MNPNQVYFVVYLDIAEKVYDVMAAFTSREEAEKLRDRFNEPYGREVYTIDEFDLWNSVGEYDGHA